MIGVDRLLGFAQHGDLVRERRRWRGHGAGHQLVEVHEEPAFTERAARHKPAYAPLGPLLGVEKRLVHLERGNPGLLAVAAAYCHPDVTSRPRREDAW